MNDDMLERLGTFFVYHRLREQYGWTFEHFIEKVETGAWKAIVEGGVGVA